MTRLWIAFDFSFSICICQTHGHCRPLFACWWVVFFCIYCLLFGQSSFTVSWEILLLDVMASHPLFFLWVHVNPLRVHDGLLSRISLNLGSSWVNPSRAVKIEEIWRRRTRRPHLYLLFCICNGHKPSLLYFFCILLCMCR